MTKRYRRASAAKRSAPARQTAAVRRSRRTKQVNGARRGNRRGHAIDHRATFRPSRKTLGATLGSAVSALAAYYANRHWPGMVTSDMASMFTVAATFAVGWIIPPGRREAIVVNGRGRQRTAIAPRAPRPTA